MTKEPEWSLLTKSEIVGIAQIYDLEANFNAKGEISFTDKIKVPKSTDNEVHQQSPLIGWLRAYQNAIEVEKLIRKL